MLKRVIFLGLIVLISVPVTAQAEMLLGDGDFAAQTVNTYIGSPWLSGGYTTAQPTAQSPYTNVYENDGLGADMLVVSWIVGDVSPAQSTGTVYYNVDFCMEGLGPQRLSLGNGYGGNPALSIFMDSTYLYATDAGTAGDWDNSNLVEVTDALSANTWYNLQLEIDLVTNTYSGSISMSNETSSEVIPIDTKALIVPWTLSGANKVIDAILADSTGPVGDSDFSLDNFAVSTTALTPLVPVPEPSVLVMVIAGLVALAWRKRA